MAIQNRFLEERAFITFEFTDSKGVHTRILPFYENLSIKESKTANYVTYKPMSRSSSLFSYTGSDARKINLSFAITLPHILAYSEKNLIRQTKSLEDGNEYFKALFFKNKASYQIKGIAESFSKVVPAVGRSSDYDAFYNDLIGVTDPTNNQIRLKCIDIIMYWVMLIRSSVVSNQEEPIYGPPIVRLSYGILYKDIPLICTDYSISKDEVAGDDNKTLLPRRILVEMTLQEIRIGDFGKFYPGVSIKGDNNAGWEVVFDERINSDPALLINTLPTTTGGL